MHFQHSFIGLPFLIDIFKFTFVAGRTFRSQNRTADELLSQPIDPLIRAEATEMVNKAEKCIKIVTDDQFFDIIRFS